MLARDCKLFKGKNNNKSLFVSTTKPKCSANKNSITICEMND